MRKRNKILITSLVLTILLLMNAVSVFALQTFTDVSSGHWASNDIEKMQKKGIITGYSDATFRPNQNVSRLSSIVMIYRTLKATNKLGNVNINYLVNKYSSDLNANNIPSWTDSREAVAYALEKNIVHRDELKTFIVNGTHQNATRSNLSVFLGKALNLYLKEDFNKQIISLDFLDAEMITTAAAPYIYLLKKHDIVNGDLENRFNPNNPITRAAVAKMLSKSYDMLLNVEDNNDRPKVVFDLPEKDDDEDDELTVQKYKLDYIVESSDTIVVVDEDGKKYPFKAHYRDVDIIVDGDKSQIDDLYEDEDIKLYFDEDDELIKVVQDFDSEFVEGEVHSVIDMDSYYILTVKDKNRDDRKKNFRIYDDTDIELDDKNSDPEDLEKGDDIELTLDGDEVVKIIAETTEREYEGILQEIGFPTIKILTNRQKVYELELDEDVDVRKNGRKSTMMNLNKGDIVSLNTENDKVVDIRATSVKDDDEGIITEIVISNNPKITILNEDDEMVTYNIAQNVDIDLEDERNVEIYDLRLDYKVELDLESDTVTDIEAEKVEFSNSISGIITEIYDDYDAIKVRYRLNGEDEYISISADDAKIYDDDGDRISFSKLDEDDEVFIKGKEKKDIFDFVADQIWITKDN